MAGILAVEFPLWARRCPCTGERNHDSVNCSPAIHIPTLPKIHQPNRENIPTFTSLMQHTDSQDSHSSKPTWTCHGTKGAWLYSNLGEFTSHAIKKHTFKQEKEGGGTWLVGAIGAVAEVVVELIPGELARSVPALDHAAPVVRLICAEQR